MGHRERVREVMTRKPKRKPHTWTGENASYCDRCGMTRKLIRASLGGVSWEYWRHERLVGRTRGSEAGIPPCTRELR